MLGKCDITVTTDAVSPADLSVQVVGGLGMTISGSSVHPSVVTTTVTAFNVLYDHQQVRDGPLKLGRQIMSVIISH